MVRYTQTFDKPVVDSQARQYLRKGTSTPVDYKRFMALPGELRYLLGPGLIERFGRLLQQRSRKFDHQSHFSPQASS
jgi:hypothetical protein